MPGSKSYLDLARELRDIVYENAVYKTWVVTDSAQTYKRLINKQSLLLSHSQIRKEVLEYFFQNCLAVHDKWIVEIGYHQRHTRPSRAQTSPGN